MYVLRTEIGQPADHLPWLIPWPSQGGGGGGETKKSVMAFANVITGEILGFV